MGGMWAQEGGGIQLVEIRSRTRYAVGRYWDCHGPLSDNQDSEIRRGRKQESVFAKNDKFQLAEIWLLKF